MRKKLLFAYFLFISILSGAQTTYIQESFDAGMPGTWVITDGGAATGDSWFSSSNHPINATNSALVDSDAFGNGVYMHEELTSPAVNTTGGSYVYLEFDQWYNNIGADSAIVQVFDGTQWVTVRAFNADLGAGMAPDHQVVDITPYSNANLQVRFVYDDANVWAWWWVVDDVHVYSVECPTLIGAIATNITAFTADLSWSDPASTGNYTIEYGPAGFTPGTGTTVTSSTIPYNLTGLIAETSYDFYVSSDCGGGNLSTVTGPVNFMTGASCPAPSGVNVTNIGSTSAQVNWTENGTASEWEIEYGLTGFVPGTGTVVNVSTNPYTLNGLTGGEGYQVYVNAVCAVGDSSSIAGPATFFTLCDTLVAPWFDGVESQTVGTVEPCWSLNSVSGFTWQANTLGTPSTGTGPLAAHEGDNYFYTEASAGAVGDVTELSTPVVDISGLASPYLSFYYHMVGATIDTFFIDINDGAGWTLGVDTLVGQQQPAQSSPWYNRLVDLNAFSGSTALTVRFRVLRGTSFTGDVAIDAISLESISCFPVTDLVSANITATSADLSWTDPNGATEWEIEYGPVGFTLGTGATTIANSNPFTVNGLVPQTNYEYYVRTICSAGDSSNWAGPSGSFTTPVADDDAMFSVFLEPSGGCGDSLTNVIVVYGNNGNNAITSMDINVEASGAATGSLSATFTGNLAFGELDTLNIGTINTYAGGSVNLQGWVTYPGDINSSNDTVWDTVFMIPFEPLGYDGVGCYADTAWLTALPGYGYEWYDASVGGNLVGTGDSLLVPSIAAQDTYYLQYVTGTTNNFFLTMAAGNGSSGNQFDLTTTTTTTVTALDIHNSVTGAMTVEVYYISNDTYVGNETNAAAWTLEGTYTVTGAGTGNPTYVQLGGGIPLVAGQSTAVYVYCPGGGIQYTNGGGAVPSTMTDGTLTFTGGIGTGAQFGNIFSPRIFNGSIYYQGDACSSIRTPVTATVGSLPTAGFSMSSVGLTVQFTDASTGADEVVYDFGDGNTSTDFNPSNTYATWDDYTVCQVVTNTCGSDTLCQSTSQLSVKSLDSGTEVKLYPNPNNGEFVVEMSTLKAENVSIEISSVTGEIVYAKNYGVVESQFKQGFDMSELVNGVYFVNVQSGDSSSTLRVVVQH